jgi:hypothetical protein
VRFREEPSINTAQCDVIVCTTATGANLSINSHLIASVPSSHGSFHVRREATVSLATGSDRYSYPFDQKCWGSPQVFGVVCATYELLRKIFFSSKYGFGIPRAPRSRRRHGLATRPTPTIGHGGAGNRRAIGHSSIPHRALGWLRMLAS